MKLLDNEVKSVIIPLKGAGMDQFDSSFVISPLSFIRD